MQKGGLIHISRECARREVEGGGKPQKKEGEIGLRTIGITQSNDIFTEGTHEGEGKKESVSSRGELAPVGVWTTRTVGEKVRARAE